MSSHYLIDEQPLMVLPTLAMVVGLNEAIVLQQIHFWLKVKASGNSDSYAHSFVDGRWWVYNSVEEWRTQQFPFWSINTIQRALTSLRDHGILLVEKHGGSYDRTNWYSIDYDILSALTVPVPEANEPVFPLPQNGVIDSPKMGQSIHPKRLNRSSQDGAMTLPQNGVINQPTLGQCLSETSSEKTQRNLHAEQPMSTLLSKEQGKPTEKDFSAHIKMVDSLVADNWGVAYIAKNITAAKAIESEDVANCYIRNADKLPENKVHELTAAGILPSRP